MIQTLGNNVTDFLVNLVDFDKSVYLIYQKLHLLNLKLPISQKAA